MSNLKAEMTLGLNADAVENGVKSINSNLESAETSAKNLEQTLDFKDSCIKSVNASLDGTADSLKEVRTEAASTKKEMDKMADTKKIGFLEKAITRVSDKLKEKVSYLTSFEGIKQGFTSGISLGLEFMQQSKEGQERVAKWQEKIKALKDGIGELFAKAMEKMEPFIDWALDTVENSLIPAIRSAAKFIYAAYTDYIGPFFASIADAWDKYGLPVVAGFMTAWTNGFDIVKGGLSAFALHYVKQFEMVKYWLTEVIPGSIAWFADVVSKNFTTIGENIKQVFTNVGKNITSFFSAIKDVATGKGWTFQSTSVSEGVKSMDTPAFRDYVPERQKSELEKSLEKNIAEMGRSIKDGYAENLAWLRSDVTPAVKRTADATEDAADGISTVADNQIAQNREQDEKAYIGGGEDEKKKGEETGSKAALEDLVAAYTRIQMGTINVTPEEQELVNLRKQAALQHLENQRLSKEQHREMMKAMAAGTPREAVVAGG